MCVYGQEWWKNFKLPALEITKKGLKKDFRKYFRYLKNDSLLFETVFKTWKFFLLCGAREKLQKHWSWCCHSCFKQRALAIWKVPIVCLRESNGQNLRAWATGSVFTQRLWISFSLGAFSLSINLRLGWSFRDHSTASNSAGLNLIMNLRCLFW